MLYDQYGQSIKMDNLQKPASGMQIKPEPMSDRQTFDVSRGMTPRHVDRILLQANGGDVEAQCQLARELPEKNHDIAAHLRTRKNTLIGCQWTVEPGDKSSQAKTAAEKLSVSLAQTGVTVPELGKIGTFRQLLRDLSDALLPGFAVSEIVWRGGGSGFFGFRPIEQRFFSFTKGYTPRLRVSGNLGDGVELPRGKIIFHNTSENGSDPARGGLIRPLAWLDCFSRVTLKDFLSFVERYGMPFVVAKVDENTWNNEKEMLNALICNFGPNGGGVFSKSTELELLQAANNTGDVYLRLLEYLGDAIAKVILGQTASSKDASGLSGGDAQSQVRQDILESDARKLEDTINSDLFEVWTRFNFSDGTPAPVLQIETGAPEDTQALAGTVKMLYEAGLQADEAEMSKKFGFKLSRRLEVSAAPSPWRSAELAETAVDSPEVSGLADTAAAEIINTGVLTAWLGPMAAAAEELNEELSDAEFKAKLARLTDGSALGDSKGVENILVREIVTGMKGDAQ